MRITRLNYESYFLDRLEGNLPSDLSDELQLFLECNPDLALELQQWDLLTLAPDPSVCSGIREELKKLQQEPLLEYDEYAFACQDEMLFPEGENFETSLHESGRLKLMPDKTIVFGNKELLKRKGIAIQLWIKVISAAAILLLSYLVIQPRFERHDDYSKLAGNLKTTDSARIVVVPPVTKKETKKPEVKVLNQPKSPVITDKIPAEKKQSPAAGKPPKNGLVVPKERAHEPEPLPLKPRGISFGIPVGIELAAITLKDPNTALQEQELSELLKVQLGNMRHSEDRELFSPDHLGLSGLQLFARLSGKRLTARKGDDGAIHSVSYNSRILAFSIPVNR